MKKTLTLTLLLALQGSAFAMGPAAHEPRISVAQKRALGTYGRDVQIELDEQNVPTHMRGQLSSRVYSDPSAAAADALALHGAAFRRGADDEFVYRVHESDTLGQTHVRMTQLYRGLPVVGGELVVHMTKSAVTGINGRFVADLDLDTTVAISEARAAAAAQDHATAQGGLDARVTELGGTVVFAGEGEPRAALTVQVMYNDVEGLQIDDVYVDAQSGAVLGKTPRVMYAKSRKIYNANQACISTGNELPGTLMFSEGGSSADTGAMGAYNNTGITYDYYKAIFNRDSYNNAGAQLTSSVHAQFSTGSSCTKNNAAWFDSLSQMAYGDGDGTNFTQLALSLDVSAHELTHAVTSRTSNLAYQKESGALNEAASDILGESAAFWNGTGDWKIGAEVYTPSTSGDALRYFTNPTQDGYSADYYPERLYSGTCTPSGSNDQCGVHGNSGIANLFYYLLSQGGTHPRGKTTTSVTGIGITAAQQIWYRALTVYMTSSTNFQGARTATSSAAADLYGGSCSANWQAVNKAWDAVGVPGTWSCGGGGSTFPESAHNYANNTDQTWTYTLAGNPASINVTFDAQTKVETNYDYIYVQDKNGVNITGSPFTSTTLAGATKNVPGDTVKIRLTSDSSVVYYGFKVTAVIAGGTPGDTTAPTTSVTAPANGSTVSGNVTISATASDNVGVTKMEVYVDGALKSSNTGASSIAYTWASTGVANGSHTITSKAYDAASNVGTSSTVTVTVSNTTSSQQLLLNPGFESGATSWTQTTGVIDNGTGQAAHGGSWKAWMNGYGSAHTDSLYQQVTIPASATTATLTFWLHIDSAETTTSTAYDTLKVQVRNSSNTVLATLATYSNLNKATGYTQKSFNLAAYKGQTVRVYFLGVEDSSKQTSFVVDDTALNVQ